MFGVSLLKQNSRKKGTLIIKGPLRNLVGVQVCFVGTKHYQGSFKSQVRFTINYVVQDGALPHNKRSFIRVFCQDSCKG